MRMMKPFPTGIGSHYLNLMHSLIKEFPDATYVVIVNKSCKDVVTTFFKDVPVEYQEIDINASSMKQHLATFYLQEKYKKLTLDVLITDPWSSFIGIPCPYILMVYDVIGFHKIVPVSLKQKLYDTFLFSYVARHASAIITSIAVVKEDVMHFFHIDEKKIFIAMPSVNSEYIKDFSEKEVQEIQEKYHLPERYFVYVGNRRPHKNIMGSVSMIEKLIQDKQHKDVGLAIIGGFDTEKKQNETDFTTMLQTTFPNAYQNLFILGRIMSNREVGAIMHGAVALLHPALFEGYGLTPLEAMYSKTAVITSNIPAIQEVVKDAAMLFNPTDEETGVAYLQKVLDNPSIRESYIKKGEKRAMEINWQNAAKNVHDAIASCAFPNA